MWTWFVILHLFNFQLLIWFVLGHRSCLNLSSTTCPRLDSSLWQCKECKMCFICKAAESEVGSYSMTFLSFASNKPTESVNCQLVKFCYM